MPRRGNLRMQLKTLCLGALCLGDATGYDIKKLFETAFTHFHHASFGSIYPALKQLESEGLVQSRVEAGPRHPDRRLFSTTAAGRSKFVMALAETPPTEQVRSEFLVLLFFAHLLPTEVLAVKLTEVERGYEQQLDYLESIPREGHASAGMALTIDLGIAASRAKLETLRAHRSSLLAHHRELPGDSAGGNPCAG